MKILLIPDSFKDSISSEEIIASLTKGIHDMDPSIEIHSIVASDGGEGFLNAVEKQKDVRPVYHDTLDPIGRTIESKYLIDKSDNGAFIELAQASGYERLTKEERNPMNTTTIGTGLQILHAINRGVKKIYVGLGGSSTNDAGIGMASVLGYSFLNSIHDKVLPIGRNLMDIDTVAGHFNFPNVEIFAVNDVENPLFGENGAAFTYGPQKGANTDEVVHLDKGLRHLHEQVLIHMKSDHAQTPGSGAAGGSGYGLKVFCNAEFISGVDFLFQISSLDALLESEDFDLIITGEGCIDEQSLQGKLISGVIKKASDFRAKVIGICGKLKLEEAAYKSYGLDAALEIAPEGTPVSESMANASSFIQKLVPAILNPES